MRSMPYGLPSTFTDRTGEFEQVVDLPIVSHPIAWRRFNDELTMEVALAIRPEAPATLVSVDVCEVIEQA